MNQQILFVFIGYNSTHLLGCENDAKIFYKSLIMSKIKYKKYLLINNDASFSNLEKIFKNNKNIDEVLIYFSGHGSIGGNLQFRDKIINPLEIYESINNIFINNLNIYFILDCCHSGSFPLVKNFQKINNVSILASCKNNQKSSESLVVYNDKTFKNSYLTFFFTNKKHIVIGAFTFNLIKLIKKYNLNSIEKLFSIENDEIWDLLEKLINQKITIIR